ncbi:MAG: single-stranded-DNA-specific exonuclease RecJ [Verrucomicrobia bacterium]|nr:single-stranded-DNA-specific exonuclease RecJ [Verrucomicrobiota bacterium]
MKYVWKLAAVEIERRDLLSQKLSLSPLLAQCLLNRGLSDPEEVRQFLDPRLKDLVDPFRLPGMELAVDRLVEARQKGESIVLFGDYDVDGVTSTALLTVAFEDLGWRTRWYLPQRMDEGYGLSRDGVEKCLAIAPCSVLLAVDCGSTATTTIDWVQSRGIDVIVLDHHQIASPPPNARALVNPRADPVDETTGMELCSVGLSFKLIHALVKRGRETGSKLESDYDLRPLLDLVALGTIADLVPLIKESRILASAGLDHLQKNRRPGIQELRSVAGSKGAVGVYEVAFQLAPRLNAAGRLEDAAEALELLLASNAAAARDHALSLDSKNRERQRIESTIVEEAIGAVRAKFNPAEDYVVVEGQLYWHIGVVGIVASRVVREFHRPTFIIGGDGTEWRGSGRSIEGFDLAAALRACDDLLIRHGGHAMAAGITIDSGNVDAFRERLNDLAKRTLRPELLMPSIKLDAEVSFSDISIESLENLNRMRPFGQGNPGVQFVTRGLSLDGAVKPIGRDKKHLKMKITDGRSAHEGVWWNGNGKAIPEESFDLAFVPEINEFNGRRSVQLRVLDWRSASAGAEMELWRLDSAT